jgi:SWI/SNF-related matrix-associated actin-dependent regulator of chromatin subfamily A3
LYARIDGTYSFSQRQKILDDYHTDTATRILLMTTGTGAIGYEVPR